MFDTTQAVLESRGEDMALRRTNGSDRLLTGLLVCEKCGKRFIGASAKGNAYRYTYYVCFSRHRYGTQECDQDRLRAEELEDRVVASVPSHDYALYSHMTVYQNMALGLRFRRMDKAEIDRRVREAARILGLSKILDRKLRALSGGQRQRVAMGRALVREAPGVPDGRPSLEPRRQARVIRPPLDGLFRIG